MRFKLDKIMCFDPSLPISEMIEILNEFITKYEFEVSYDKTFGKYTIITHDTEKKLIAMKKQLNELVSQQFDNLGLSIAELIYNDIECSNIYNNSINRCIIEGLGCSECMEVATNEVKKFVVERQARLESEDFEYFNLGTI